MADNAKLVVNGKDYDLPVVVGTEDERGVDISRLRADLGHITLDSGYNNTAECQSEITFVDGEAGILRYRGIPVEQLAQKSTFVETTWLLIYGELPSRQQLECWSALFTKHEMLHEGLHHGGFGAETGRPS